METLSKSVACPRCGRPATVMLSEDVDRVRGTEGHVVKLACSNFAAHPPCSEAELLRLWAADRAAIWIAAER